MDERNIMHGIMVDSNSGTEGDQAVAPAEAEAETGLRRGPWTVEEDLVLVNNIAVHGEGRWNSLARAAGLKRSGKSCRLRWLNYLRPGVRRGNFTPEEQLVILDLHSRWGNRWSKIAQHLPGRTDNEIKNYWRTRVQKHAKQLKCDVSSQQFKDAVRYLWMPRLIERIQAASESAATASASASAAALTTSTSNVVPTASTVADTYVLPATTVDPTQPTASTVAQVMSLQPDHSNMGGMSPDSPGVTWLPSPPVSNLTDYYIVQGGEEFPTGPMVSRAGGCSESLLSPCGYYFDEGVLAMEQSGWDVASGFSSENLWVADDITWFLQQKL